MEALGIPDQVGHHDFYINGSHYWPGFFCRQNSDHKKCIKNFKSKFSDSIQTTQFAENKTGHKSNLNLQLELKDF